MMRGLILFLCSLLSTGVFAADVEKVSVMEGDSVTLHADAGIKINMIEWRFGKNLIASVDTDDRDISVDPKGVFGGRLQLDSQTGDLKITNITNSDSGLYQLQINSKEPKTFSVRAVSHDQTASVLMGDSVTLPSGVTDTQLYDVNRWRFGDQKSPIAEVNRKTGTVSYDGAGERLRGRLQMDYWTGSLTIINTKTTDSGDYEVELIRRGNHTIHKSFSVTVSGEIQSVSVTEGESVALNTGSGIERRDAVTWVFGDTFIASIQDNMTTVDKTERFRDRLKLDHQTGSLTITNTRNTDSGDYQLKISSRKHIIHHKFRVTVIAVPGSGLSAGAVAWICVGVMLIGALVVAGVVIYYRRWISKLKCDEIVTNTVRQDDYLTVMVTGVQRDDQMQWKCNGTLIAQIKGGTTEIFPSAAGGRFRGRLKLDPTGSLTIEKMRPTDDGDYHLYNTKTGRKMKSFSVKVRNPGDNGDNPEGMPLTHFYFH